MRVVKIHDHTQYTYEISAVSRAAATACSRGLTPMVLKLACVEEVTLVR